MNVRTTLFQSCMLSGGLSNPMDQSKVYIGGSVSRNADVAGLCGPSLVFRSQGRACLTDLHQNHLSPFVPGRFEGLRGKKYGVSP